MKNRFIGLALFACFVAAALSAQTKTAGTVTCKSDPSTPVALTDKPNHAFVAGSEQCTWAGFEVAGVASKTGVSGSISEITGDSMTGRGYHVTTFANGDTTVVKFMGSGKLKDGKPVSLKGTWSYVSGTGKFKGITGKGTYNGTVDAAGVVTHKVEGEYSLAK